MWTPFETPEFVELGMGKGTSMEKGLWVFLQHLN